MTENNKRKAAENTLHAYFKKLKPDNENEASISELDIGTNSTNEDMVMVQKQNNIKINENCNTDQSDPSSTSQFIYDVGAYLKIMGTIDEFTKYQLLKNHWKPNKNFTFPYSSHVKRGREEKRRANLTHLEKYEWLVFSCQKEGLFCKYCAVFSSDLLVGGQKTVSAQNLVTKPLNKYSKLTGKDGDLEQHQSTKYHGLSIEKGNAKMHGVKRVILFFVMTAVLPAILIVTPLYLRHYIFADVTFPVAESDVLAISEGYSSIFCDALKLTMNSSFNAFQLVGTPKISKKRRHIRLKKSMTLPDDTLEYWGFYLLKGATVRVKVCSRHEGARILVVRGGKNLNTCGLMDHNYVAFGAKMDAEYKEVKVFDEEPADYVGELDMNSQMNNAREDMTDDEAKDKLILNDPEQKETISQTPIGGNEQTASNSKVRHQRRHTKRWRRKVDELKRSLEVTESRPKRSISPLDAHIKHGGNAMNFTDDINLESDSVSSFETDLLRCYDSKILLSRGFVPSRLCNTMEYLDKSNHMVTEHTVVSDGYYYYIFYSDNDFVKNDIHAVFNIYKPTYRFANTSSGNECINQTKCEFPIHLISDETVIVEVPTRDGIEHEDDDITLLTSTCKPRMGVYMIFPVLVLLSILICAFL